MELKRKYDTAQSGVFSAGTSMFEFYRSFFRNVVRRSSPSSIEKVNDMPERIVVRYRLTLSQAANLAEFTNFRIPPNVSAEGVRSDIRGIKVQFYGGSETPLYVRVKFLYGKEKVSVVSPPPKTPISPAAVLKQCRWMAEAAIDCTTAVATVIENLGKRKEELQENEEYQAALNHVIICGRDLCYDCKETFDLV